MRVDESELMRAWDGTRHGVGHYWIDLPLEQRQRIADIVAAIGRPGPSYNSISDSLRAERKKNADLQEEIAALKQKIGLKGV